jgi:hypothetical protein
MALQQVKGEDKMQHLHLQCLLRLPSINVNAVEVQQACADLVYKHTYFMEGQGHVYAEAHWPDAQPNVTWRTMVGYVCYNNIHWIFQIALQMRTFLLCLH